MIPDCGYFLSKVDLYLFGALGYHGWLKKYWHKFHIVEVPFQHHGIQVYSRFKSAAEKIGLSLFVWGANDLHLIERLKVDKVDGIITDRPNLV